MTTFPEGEMVTKKSYKTLWESGGQRLVTLWWSIFGKFKLKSQKFVNFLVKNLKFAFAILSKNFNVCTNFVPIFVIFSQKFFLPIAKFNKIL